MSWKNTKYGLQKMTLLDYPGKVACTVFSSGCNFRCPFCHNASLVLPDADTSYLLDGSGVLSFLKKRQGLLDGVCLTGGEPLMRQSNLAFLAEVKALGYQVKLDTNGSYPDRLADVLNGGLADYVAMDIKNSGKKYSITAGVEADVRASVELLKASAIPYEFRTTVVRQFHTEEDMIAIGEWLQGSPKYFLQKFTDSGDLIGQGLSAVPDEEMRYFLSVVRRYIPSAELRGM